MDTPFFCTDCRSQHAEPADAMLGHLVLCLDCALLREVPSRDFAFAVAGPLMAVDQASIAA